MTELILALTIETSLRVGVPDTYNEGGFDGGSVIIAFGSILLGSRSRDCEKRTSNRYTGAYFLGLLGPHMMTLLKARMAAAVIYQTIDKVSYPARVRSYFIMPRQKQWMLHLMRRLSDWEATLSSETFDSRTRPEMRWCCKWDDSLVHRNALPLLVSVTFAVTMRSTCSRHLHNLSEYGEEQETTLMDELQGLSWSARAGQAVAFAGHSGCGKSTSVLQILCDKLFYQVFVQIGLLTKLYEKCGGEIIVDGKNIAEYDRQTIRKVFSVTFR